MIKLAGAAGKAARALRFLIFTVCRTSEVLGARWDELDRPAAAWKIPGARMKMGEDQSVPLSEPALAILDQMRDGSQGDLIFPAAGDEHFSDMAMLAVFDRLGYGHVTVHGFRATFATWAVECTDYPEGVREAALAHKYKNETMAAHKRGQKLEKRRALMNDWAEFLPLSLAVIARSTNLCWAFQSNFPEHSKQLYRRFYPSVHGCLTFRPPQVSTGFWDSWSCQYRDGSLANMAGDAAQPTNANPSARTLTRAFKRPSRLPSFC